MRESGKRIDCYKCVHYVVTWDRNQPRGCKLFGFKSRELPSVTVYTSTGSDCEGFTPKNPERNRR